ncbi:MAG TPA: response regulator transcription factor [Deltaproteobacteria bacterium]|nr:response regulator transcription factor [Deltaproteobacteria bacterium]
MSPRVLVIDDEPDILELVRFGLQQEGFDVETATSGKEGLGRVSADPPDLVVLDLMLPDVSGTEVCRRIRSRSETADLPVVMLTARAEELDRVVGFEVGADDYVTKPFSSRELALRVKAVLRRRVSTSTDAESPLSHGSLELDPGRHRCRVAGKDVALTAKEFGLLQLLMSRAGRVLTREKLLDDLWGADVAVTHRTVDTHLKRLREKLGEAGDYIHTVRGVGYRFEE